MNGYHRELFSWDLCKREFYNKEFKPFNEVGYRDSVSYEEEPCIVLDSFSYKENSFAIDIYYENKNNYIIYK
jgi:hypothetical protein